VLCVFIRLEWSRDDWSSRLDILSLMSFGRYALQVSELSRVSLSTADDYITSCNPSCVPHTSCSGELDLKVNHDPRLSDVVYFFKIPRWVSLLYLEALHHVL